jgi:Tol biopolymer transport system component/DNA-binding winged helix-turn-helix (wHTH) protein
MEDQASAPTATRFGPFELFVVTGELRKNGVRLKLSGQPIRVLACLLGTPGQLVTREELQQELWPGSAYGDFEKGLNAAVNRLRENLEDSATEPKYIETIPGRGYRFIADIDSGLPSTPSVEFEQPKPRSKRTTRFVGVALLIALSAGALAYLGMRPPAVPRVSNYVQLTHDGQPKVLVGTDGSRIYLRLGTDVSTGIGEIPISGGEPTRIPAPQPGMYPLNLSPDGSQLLVTQFKLGPDNRSLWSLPVLGGSPRRLGHTLGDDAALSPDGKLLAYSNDNYLFVANADGTESRTQFTAKSPLQVDGPVWSLDGRFLRFNLWQGWTKSLWEVAVDGSRSHQLLPGWRNPPDECCGRWTADGKYFVFQSNGQIWALPEKHGLLHDNPKPEQLTSSPLALVTPVPSRDGKKLFVVGKADRGELVRYDFKSGQFVPFLGGISAEFLDVSKDGQWVAYVSYPEGTLWRSRIDGSERLQLTFPPDFATVPRWSPDGKTIVFGYRTDGEKLHRIYEVSSEGGSRSPNIPGLDARWR